MNDLLDLCIKLKAPPPGSSPDLLATVDLTCSALGLSHDGDLLHDPLSPQERADLRWYLEEYWKWPFGGFARRGAEVERQLPVIGQRLFAQLFQSATAQKLIQNWRLQLAQPGWSGQISILSDIPAVLSLPWELLHDGQGFLTLRTRQPAAIMRRLDKLSLGALRTRFTPPLRVLLVSARPEGTGFVDPRGIARELLEALEAAPAGGAVELEFLRPATLPALRRRLANAVRPIHIFHFDGHGTFSSEPVQPLAPDGVRLHGGARGQLAFEDDRGELALVPAETLAQVLQDSDVKLAVLTACQSGQGSNDDVFSSVAGRLLGAGVDAVVAMSASVLVVSAARYVEAFYRELSSGLEVPLAHERARQALHDDPQRHVLRRRRDEPGEPVQLCDWWLPHYFQQRPLTLQPTAGPTRAPATPPHLEGFPGPPTYGWIGRARELLAVERALLRRRLVLLSGFGGVGKTALAREVADWLVRTRLFRSALFLSFEHGRDATQLLGALGSHLGLRAEDFNPYLLKLALQKLQPALQHSSVLLVIDNFESVLPGGEAALDDVSRTQLLVTLRALAKMGAGIVITSRDGTPIGTPEERAHMRLEGLDAEDAYALASRILNNTPGLKRSAVPYAELCELLARLGHHPLAIQLVLPTMREIPLEQVAHELDMLLPRFVDDATTGRNASLSASLEYSLRRLSSAQRELLSRIAPFEGGAYEMALLRVTGMSHKEWEPLRQALERAGLLTTRPIHKNIAHPFHQFHPILTPYLRSLPGALTGNLHGAYLSTYVQLASYLNDYENEDEAAVRAVFQTELPNMRRALDGLHQIGHVSYFVLLAGVIAVFLDYFGQFRERDMLRERVQRMLALAGEQLGENDELLTLQLEHELDQAVDEHKRGDLHAALSRLEPLQQQIAALGPNTSVSPGSFHHFRVVRELGVCLNGVGRLREALVWLQQAEELLARLIEQNPDAQLYFRMRGLLLSDLANIATSRGDPAGTRTYLQQSLAIVRETVDLRQFGIVSAQLGDLERHENNLEAAAEHYTRALAIFRALGEPRYAAKVLTSLSGIAEAQGDNARAETILQDGLAAQEQIGAQAEIPRTNMVLGLMAKQEGRYDEAEVWFRRALAFPALPANLLAKVHYSLAVLLLDEAQDRGGRRLDEARTHAEESLCLGTGDETDKPWETLKVLALIAQLQGHHDDLREFRRREREAFAQAPAYRAQLDAEVGGWVIACALARAYPQLREKFDGLLTAFVQTKELSDGLSFLTSEETLAALRRVWDGERDWHALAEGLTPVDALFILRVLETIENPTQGPPFQAGPSLGLLRSMLDNAEEIWRAVVAGEIPLSPDDPRPRPASVPRSLLDTARAGDAVAFTLALDRLPDEHQSGVFALLKAMHKSGQIPYDPDALNLALVAAHLPEQFRTLSTYCAMTIVEGAPRANAEGILALLEGEGWSLLEPMRRIWAGERNLALLATNLDNRGASFIWMVLKMVQLTEVERSQRK